MGKDIKVHLKKGKFKEDLEVTKMDPYVILKIGDKKHKSKVHKNAGKYPKWKQQMSIEVKDYDEKVFVSVWDHDTLSSDDLIGKWVIDLHEALKNSDKKQKYDVYKNEKVVGEIYIRFEKD